MTRCRYIWRLSLVWIYTAIWVSALGLGVAYYSQLSVWQLSGLVLVLVLTTPAIEDLFVSYDTWSKVQDTRSSAEQGEEDGR